MLSHRVVGLKSKRAPTADSIDHIVQQLLAPSKRPRVTVLLGAGVSVAAGIPDYRSPGGMYETLRPELLTASEDERDMMRDDPTNVVSLTLFEQNQLPFLELLRPVILGVAEKKWQPVLAHRFLQVLHEKGMLRHRLPRCSQSLFPCLTLLVCFR
jgi:NAD-dependent SIR2 family protein deacetylase